MTRTHRNPPRGWLRFPEVEFRAAVAEDRRLRRRAARLRLLLEKSRGEGGWTLSSIADGSIIIGPRSFTWQISETLDQLLNEARAEELL
jgi:hypothetical protein